MKIQISPTKKIEDALCIWPDMADGVDIAADPRLQNGLEFRQNSISAIYAFDICGMSLPDDLPAMLRRLYGFLKQKGQLYIIDHDYDYICRSYLSGDLPLAQINEDFRRVCYLNKESIVKLMIDAGFQEKNLRQWYEAKFPKRHFEIIIAGEK